MAQYVEPTGVPIIHSDVGHQSTILSIAFSPDGTQILSGSWDGTAKLWDVASGRLLQTFFWGSRKVNQVAWSPDGKIVAIAADPAEAALSEDELASYQAYFSERDTSFMDTDRNGPSVETRLFDPCTGDLLRVIDDAGDGVAFAPDGKTLAVVSWTDLTILDRFDGRCLARFESDAMCLRSVCYSVAGRSLACVADDGVRVFDARTAEPYFVARDPLFFDEPGDFEHAVDCSPNSHDDAPLDQRAASMADFWQKALGDFRPISSCDHTVKRPGVAFSPDGKRIACVEASGTSEAGDDVPSRVTILDAKSLAIERVIESPTRDPMRGWLRTIAFSADGRLLAAAGDQQTILVWDAASGREVCRIGQPPPAIVSVAFSPTGSLLAAGAEDGTVFLCDPKEPNVVALDDSWEAPLVHVEFSPSGETLLLASREGKVRLVDVPSFRTQLEFRCHQGPLVGGTITADGTRFVSVGYGNQSASPVDFHSGRNPEIRLWSVADGQELGLRQLLEEAHITSIAASPDRTRLAISSWHEVYTADVTDEVSMELRIPTRLMIHQVAFVGSASCLLVADEGYGMRSVDLERKRWGDWIIATRAVPASFAMDAGAKVLARSTCCNNEIELFEIASGKLKKYFLGHQNATNSLTISPDDRLPASGSRDGTVKFWDLKSGCLNASIVLRSRTDTDHGSQRWQWLNDT